MHGGELVGGRFEIEHLAGEGGMGAVYRARDRATGEPVALKVIRAADDALAARFGRETEILAALDHPAIVRYVAHGVTDDGLPWLAMAWLEGETLEERIARAGALGVSASVLVVRRVAEALGAAHARGVVHRDVKPNNVFLPGGRVGAAIVLDFGVARWEGAFESLTATGAAVGTVGFMAPEQARGERGIDARADVFALGCLLYECVTGRPAFEGGTVGAVLARLLLEPAPRLADAAPEVPPALDALCGRMLAKDPAARPRDGGEVARALADIAADAPPRAALRSEPPRALTTDERRVVSLVWLAGAPAALVPSASEPADAALGATVVEPAAEARAALRAAAAAHGARLEVLADGGAVAMLDDAVRGNVATDQAARAARVALALREAAPDARVALVTGHGVASARTLHGEVIERAARLVALAPAGGAVRTDETTAALLDARFELAGDLHGPLLRGERDAPVVAARTLLGRPTPCVGRDRELARLEALWDECASGPRARAVLVTAPPGVGKSRLWHELFRRLGARERPVTVLYARGEPGHGGAAYGLVGQALRRAAGVRDGEPVETRRARLRARVGRAIDEPGAAERVAMFLGEVAGAPWPADADPQLRAARADARSMADRVREAWVAFVAAECAARPALLVLEDLHWGDAPSAQLVDAALGELASAPWMVLALARPEVREALPGLWAARDVVTLPLAGLPRRAAEQLAREVLGPRADGARLERLVARAGGNAFFLEELLRAAATPGRDDERALPESVAAMAQARLDALDADARRVLRAASVFGEAFWLGAVAALVGGAARRDAVARALDALCDDEVVARYAAARFGGEVEYRFRHALVRDAAYATLTDEDRRLGHLLAGAWLERAGEGDAAAVAEHYERGGDGARAAPWLLRAAERALAANDFAGAVGCAARGLAHAPPHGALRGELFLVRATAARWSGRSVDAARDGADAMALLAPGSRSWFAAAGEVARAAGRLADAARLEALVHAVATVTPHPGAGAAAVDAYGAMVLALATAGRADLAGALIDRAEATARDARDAPAAAAGIERMRSTLALHGRDLSGFLRASDAWLAHLERAGDLRTACSARCNAGYARVLLGLYEDARAVLERARAEAVSLGARSVQLIAEQNLGVCLARLGRLDDALSYATGSLEAFTRSVNHRLAIGSRIYLAEIHTLRGELDAAEREARAAADAAERLRGMRAAALAHLARALLAQGGRAREALGAAREAHALLEAHGALEEGEGLARLALAEAELANGETAAARATLAAARAALRETAARIADPALRASFLTRVPENARTLALAAELLGEPDPAR